MFLYCDWKIRATLYCGIVCDDHAGDAFDYADPRDDSCAWPDPFIHPDPSKLRELQERGSWVNKPRYSVYYRELSTFNMFLYGVI